MSRRMTDEALGPLPPMVSIVGRRNSGKTTLLVGLAAELRRRGLRVASLKHSHHEFEMDVPGKDSWRHFHEGGVEAVVIASPAQRAARAAPQAGAPRAGHGGGRSGAAGFLTGPLPGELHCHAWQDRP